MNNLLINILRSLNYHFSLDIFWDLNMNCNFFINVDWLLNHNVFFSIDDNWVRFLDVFRNLNVPIDGLVDIDLLNDWLDNWWGLDCNWDILESLDNLNLWLGVNWNLTILRNLFDDHLGFSLDGLDVGDLNELLERNRLLLNIEFLVGHSNRH